MACSAQDGVQFTSCVLCPTSASATGWPLIFFRKSLGNNSIAQQWRSRRCHAHWGPQCFEAAEVFVGGFNAHVLQSVMMIAVTDKQTVILTRDLLYLSRLARHAIASLTCVSSMPLFVLGRFGSIAFSAGGIKPNDVVLRPTGSKVKNHNYI